MINKFIKRFESRKQDLENVLKKKHPQDYKELVTNVVKILRGNDERDSLDPERIYEINDSEDHGTLLYVIATGGWEPSDYYAVKVAYGSCAGCDTLLAILGHSSAPPSEKQVKDYMTLSMHIVQGLREIECGGVKRY